MDLIRRSSHTALVCALLGAALVPLPAWASDTAAPRAAASPDDTNPQVIQVLHDLDAAEASAAAASTRALDASAAAEQAREQADATASRAATLTAQSTAADAALATAKAHAGASAAMLYRTSADGPLVAQLLATADPDDLLTRLGLLNRLTEMTTRSAGDAESASNLASSLRAQAQEARDEAARLAAEAASTAATATSTAATENATVTATQTQLNALYARLAALRATTAAQERAKRLAEQTAAQAAAPGGATGGPSTPSDSGSGSNGGSGSGASSGSNSGSGGGSGSGGSSNSNGGSGSGGGSGSSGSGTAPAGPIMSSSQARDTARGMIGGYGWGDDQFSCLVSLWNRESGWRADAYNGGSGAYGIPQALPGEKMASAGPDWRTNAATQIAWGLSYINSRYGSPCGAWGHSQATGWY